MNNNSNKLLKTSDIEYFNSSFKNFINFLIININ